MKRIPLIFPVTLLPAEFKRLDEIKESLADLAKRLGKLQGTSKHVDLTLIIGAAFNIKEVQRLQHVTDCTNHSYELRMAIIKIETAYNKFEGKVQKQFINDVVDLMHMVSSIESMLLRAYKKTFENFDTNHDELPFH
jgi:Glu-tRNA(Gln) amidotransferase subunit E-like FAD-binding protein